MPVLLTKNIERSLRDVNEEIHRRLQRGESASFIYVVPTKRKVRDLQREFLRYVPGTVAPAFHLFTFETLAAELYSLLPRQQRIVSGPVQAVIMNEAIRSVEGSLRYFRLHGRGRTLPQGTFQKIINVINELKEHGVYRSVLYDELQNAETGEQNKLQDILTIYDAYEQFLGDRYIDVAGMLKEVNACWDPVTSGEKFLLHVQECDTIYISGFDEFSDPELTMLYHLANIKKLGVVVSFDYHLDNDAVFGHLKENYQKLLEMGFRKSATGEDDTTTFSGYITRHLFQHHALMTTRDCTNLVTLVQADSREQEVELIAKIIKRLVEKHPGRDLSKICVSMYYPQTYTNIFREVFARYGIPSNITDRYNLNQSPIVVSILALLAVEERNFRLDDIMRALSSAYFDFSSGGETIDAGNLYSTASLLKISGGKANWAHRIDQQLRFIDEELTSAADETEVIRLRREESMLKKARTDITLLVDLLERFREPLTPAEFKRHVVALIDHLHIVDRLLRVVSPDHDQLERDTRAFQKFIAFIDEFIEILILEGKETARERLSFYLDRLRHTIVQVRYNVRQKYGYGVYVTSFDETRGLNFDTMVIAGMVDGEFPPMYMPEIFFSSSRRYRKELYHLREHRYLFYQALTNFSEQVFLMIPRFDGDRELVPSAFLEALQKVIRLNDQRETLAKQLSENIYSRDELLCAVGKSIGGGNADIPFLNNQVTVRQELQETFDHMRHCMNIEQSRTATKVMPEYNGTIFSHIGAEARARLDQFRRRIYSVTQLESYGKCPYQFFADKVLRLNVVEAVEEGLSPLERGGVLHEILFEFYSQRREQRLSSLADATDEQFATATTMLLSLARKKLDGLHVSEIFWDVDKEMILGSSLRTGLLQEFLQVERERKVTTSPAFFELAFGSRVGSKTNEDVLLKHEEPIQAEKVQLRGKVDRVDVGDEVFTIIDYKSGKTVAGRKEIDLGMSLQLPLYLYAVEHILNEHNHQHVAGAAGIYYTLKPPVKEILGIGSDEHRGKAFYASANNAQLTSGDDELRSIIKRAVAFVNDYVDNIAKGNFPVDPRMPEHVCTYCDFKTICRIQVQHSSAPVNRE
jgi:ATP-dependent helicase/nuclease subunit B